MSLQQLLNRPVTIRRQTASGPEDVYGNPTEAVATVTTVGELQQQQRAEASAYGEVIVTTWLLVLPAGTPIDASDQVIVDGDTYEVQGQPWHARSPRTGTEHHVEATLRQLTGADG